MPRPLRLLLLSPLFLLAAVPARSADDKMLSSPYFPTEKGTAWHYRVGESRYSVWVADHEKVGSQMTARLEMYTTDKKKPIARENIAVTGDAVVRVSSEGKALTPPVPFLKLPPRKDESWKVDSKQEGQVLKGVFKAGEETVKVPSGSYRAVTVTGQDLEVAGAKLNLTYYFAEKVGMVKQQMELGGQKIVVELEKFEPAK